MQRSVREEAGSPAGEILLPDRLDRGGAGSSAGRDMQGTALAQHRDEERPAHAPALLPRLDRAWIRRQCPPCRPLQRHADGDRERRPPDYVNGSVRDRTGRNRRMPIMAGPTNRLVHAPMIGLCGWPWRIMIGQLTMAMAITSCAGAMHDDSAKARANHRDGTITRPGTARADRRKLSQKNAISGAHVPGRRARDRSPKGRDAADGSVHESPARGQARAGATIHSGTADTFESPGNMTLNFCGKFCSPMVSLT